MIVAVEVSRTVIDYYMVEVPDETRDEDLYDAVSGNRDNWVLDPDLECLSGEPSTDAIFKLNADGDLEDEPSWPKEEKICQTSKH